MAFNYDPSKYRSNQLLSSLIACSGIQFMSLGVGLWWLSIVAGALMIVGYRQPELYVWKKELKTAIIAAQIPNVIMGVFLYYSNNYKQVIIFTLLIYSLLFPIRIILKTNSKINAARRKNESA
jgi:hypothetical protein